MSEFGIGSRTSSNLLLAQKGLPPSDEEELTLHSQAEGDTAGAIQSPKKTRKRVETKATRSLGYGIAKVFPFCWLEKITVDVPKMKT